MEKNILLYGLNRSGTNYLEELVKKHFIVKFLNNEDYRDQPKHKHFRLYDNKTLIGRPNYQNHQCFDSFKSFEEAVTSHDKPDLFFVISKDPYSWNISYTNWGYKHKWDKSPHPYILEYNEFYKKWIEFAEESEKIVFVRYIDLLIDRENFLKNIYSKYNLELTASIENSKGLKKVPMSRRFTSKKFSYYAREKYLNEYSREELSDLNNHIDHQLIKRMGYKSYF